LSSFRIESLLSARQFIAPQLWGDRIYFVSNLSGHMSLYVMDVGGSVPEPLLPPDVVLQNPHLLARHLYYVFPALGKILILLDNNGDEHYQPVFIPIEGGLPEIAFDNYFSGYRVQMMACDPVNNIVYFSAEANDQPVSEAFRCNMQTGEITRLHGSEWEASVDTASSDHNKVILTEDYTIGDRLISLWEDGQVRVLYGVPLNERTEGQVVPLNAIHSCQFVNNDNGLLFISVLFDDAGSLGYMDLQQSSIVTPVTITGAVHSGVGEMDRLSHLEGNLYVVGYNIDGCSWLYEAEFNFASLTMKLGRVICGVGYIGNGVLESRFYDKDGDRHILSYSTAISPTQIYTVAGDEFVQHTRERILGIPVELLSTGEDASFTSHDGLRTSARLYLPTESLDYAQPYPLVYYVHGGPQAQERPDFSWFSMPIIQFLTLNGFAVFVPNVRGSVGYGLSYTKHVDRDWGGQDRLDHVYAMKLLADDPRIDTSRAGVVGRSYGGYMTLTLAFRHPELWKAAVDMFGPYDLLTFMDRIPETWKPYFRIAVGDPVDDHAFLVERSPRTYMHQLQAPMLVIQGKNDPRVIERESRDVVEALRTSGKAVDYLMFEDEGHDVLKYENRVRCYNAITDFFKAQLM
jgi:pimeloyl-ACP methyl ester carboxylesterase